MNLIQSFQRYVLLVFCLLIVSVTYTAYVTISNIVEEQSRLQQQAASPMFTLVSEEILRPLKTVETLARANYFHPLLDKDTLDQKQIIETLAQLQEAFKLEFFIASEKSRVQFFSNGQSLELVENEVAWYFEALANPKTYIADLGQVGDVQLYFDVKIYNEKDELLGIVGANKSLEGFLEKFKHFKSLYGYDFLILNENDNIILTSFPHLQTVDEYIPQLTDVEGFEELEQQYRNTGSLNGISLTQGDAHYLLSEVRIQQLDWRVVMLLPLEARQAELTKTFLINSIAAALFIIVAFVGVFWLVNYFRKNLEKSLEKDSLTGIANRQGIEQKFSALKNRGLSISVILIDVDHFKSINDNYGHLVGDVALKRVASILGSELRADDIVGRWGGEEFLILVPTQDSNVAKSIAERTRLKLEQQTIEIDDISLSITASFGVSNADKAHDLKTLVSIADQALYQAKSLGRNRVEFVRLPE